MPGREASEDKDALALRMNYERTTPMGGRGRLAVLFTPENQCETIMVQSAFAACVR